jgi:hypothetical protein
MNVNTFSFIYVYIHMIIHIYLCILVHVHTGWNDNWLYLELEDYSCHDSYIKYTDIFVNLCVHIYYIHIYTNPYPLFLTPSSYPPDVYVGLITEFSSSWKINLVVIPPLNIQI